MALAINVWTFFSPQTAYPSTLVVAQTLDFNGFAPTIDSFNSTNELYSTGGFYDPTKAQDHGDVTTLSGASNALAITNAKIKGTAHTGPGGIISISSQGSVGDMDWVNSGQPGVQSGHLRDDATQTIADAVLPDTGAMVWQTAAPSVSVINSVTYKYVLSDSRPWKLSSLDGSVYVSKPGVKLWVQNAFNLPSNGEIRIPAGNSLAMYVTAATATIGGNGIVNDTGLSRNFQYYGLSSNAAFVLSANAPFAGSIYAPQAAFTFGGGDNNTYGFVGCIVAKSMKLYMHCNFHLDEALQAFPPAIMDQPQNQTVLAGQMASFSVTATGAQPLDYQWQLNGTDLLGATNFNYKISNADATNSGGYSVIVSNAFGSLTSSNASLSVYDSAAAVLALPRCLTNNQFQLSLTGVPGFTYAIQASTNLADWIFLGTNSSPFIFLDYEASDFPQRFYRALYIP